MDGALIGTGRVRPCHLALAAIGHDARAGNDLERLGTPLSPTASPSAWNPNGLRRSCLPCEPWTRKGSSVIDADLRTAELAKHASNVFLALKISFANGVARIGERTGADIEAVADVMGPGASPRERMR